MPERYKIYIKTHSECPNIARSQYLYLIVLLRVLISLLDQQRLDASFCNKIGLQITYQKFIHFQSFLLNYLCSHKMTAKNSKWILLEKSHLENYMIMFNDAWLLVIWHNTIWEKFSHSTPFLLYSLPRYSTSLHVISLYHVLVCLPLE